MTASTLRDLGAASDILCVCVVADADVEAVLRGENGALAGMAPDGVVIVHNTVHPDTCRRLQADHPELAALDAPVSGGGHQAAARDLLVMVGGEPQVLERCRPLLETFANPLVHLGSLGAWQEAKLLNNAVFTAHLGLAASVYAVATSRAMNLDAFSIALRAGSGRSYGAEVVAGGGYGLERMAELAGPLLSKDVRILADLLAPEMPHVITAAYATLAGMGLPT